MDSTQNQERGNQEPRIKVCPDYEYTFGEDAASLAIPIGYELDDWQDEILSCWLSVDESNKYVSMRNGLSVPRQNGKTALVIVRCSYGALMLGERILYTAHEYSTVTETLEAFTDIFGTKKNDPDALFHELNAEVSRVRRVNGKEAIFFKNGGSIHFSTRTAKARRGQTYDAVIFDEAQYLTELQLKSMMSTASSGPKKNPQFIFLGTPPGPEITEEVFPRLRSNVIAGLENKFSWFEWSIEKLGDVSDRSRWYETNPALGVRLVEDVIEAELGSLEELSFAQERLGYWLEKSSNAIIHESEWEWLATESPAKADKIAYGVKFSAKENNPTVSLCVATKPTKGLPHIEWIRTELIASGTSWLSDFLIERKEKIAVVVVDGKAGAETLKEKLRQGGFPEKAITLTNPKEVAMAASLLLDDIHEEAITHFDQPPLNQSALNVYRRKIGNDGGFGFGGTDEVDSTPIEAASIAHWGVMTTKRDPKRKMRVG